jgi:hypothetical protein
VDLNPDSVQAGAATAMDALWLVPPVIVADIAGLPSPAAALLASHLASARLRTGVATAAWQKAGHRNLFLAPDDHAAVARTDFTKVRLCVVGKLFLDVRPADWLATCVRAKESGAKLILDICDYPFAQKPPDVVRFYEEALRLADAVTVNSGRMAELMSQHTTQAPQVIEDAILAAPRRPEFAPGKVLELLWFGHINNARYLERMMDALIAYSAKQRCRLTIVTEPGQGVEQAARQITQNCAPRFEARFAAWSLEATRIALRQCDLVLIPGDPSDPLKSGVSSNRLAETLQAGRLPVASPLASYLPFGESAWLGDDLVAGITWAMVNRGEVLVRLRRGQTQVMERLAQEAIGKQWCRLFGELAAD